MPEKLAIFGGEKAIRSELKHYNPIGKEELEAASKVIQSGNLSQFVGSWCDDFYGGPKVQEFEERCCKYFDVKHSVTVNSWTSGLIAAIGAIGIEPGDEVIVPTWTMCASATAILHWNGIPVFADIDRNTFNISIESIKSLISPYTRAILAVDIFGQSCNIQEIMHIAERYNLKVITDTAQAPGAIRQNRKTGTESHIGGYSLNYHKHIHTGEGGILVTNDDNYSMRLKLIRNHGEAVVNDANICQINNIIGYNFRLGEIEAAIGIEQLKKLDYLVKSRQNAAKMISETISKLRGLDSPYIERDSTHSYYVYPIKLNLEELDVTRAQIISALKAEGIKEGLAAGYANIHQLPMYQKKIAYGNNGFPWNSDICKREVNYAKGSCPIAEELHEQSFIGFEMCLYDLNKKDIKNICNAFEKVWDNLDSLRDYN